MSYKMPMGPYHPALEEPYKLDMICEGETVQDAKLHIGFNFRGIEHLAETRNYIQVTALMERVCGICSNIHTLTLCQAMEQLPGLTPPLRALYIRVVMAEWSASTHTFCGQASPPSSWDSRPCSWSASPSGKR